MKTHIYKVYKAAACTLLLTAALAACTDDSREPMQENETPREGIFFSVTATQGEGAETRVDYKPNGDQGMNVKWAVDDKIYVGKLPLYGYDYISSLLSPLDIAAGGVGQTTAQFDGTIANEHLPASGKTLYAFYGKADKIYVEYGDIYYDYTGQRQTANGNMKHAAEYDFMEASTAYTPGANHRFSFSHVGSMMKFTLGGLEGQKVNKLTLSTYDGSWVFPDELHFTESVSLNLGVDSSNGISLGSSETLEAYLMMEPTTETVGKNLVLYVTTTDGKNFATLLTGAEIAAGKLYTVDATLTEYTFAETGEQGDPYKINDAGDLTKLAVMTNMGWIATSGKYFQLTADINMKTGAEAWVPIGRLYNEFEGTFLGGNGSGGNHSISNLPGKMADEYAGLFGSVDGAIIKNVTVSGEIAISGAGNISVGGIAGYVRRSTIADCNSNCTIGISGTDYAYVGGIMGYSYGDNIVTNCTNEGAISSNYCSGGIIGCAWNSGEITNCTNRGEITSTDTNHPAGGIIGFWGMSSSNSSATLTGCTHEGRKPVQGAAGSIIGKYDIRSSASGSSITLTNSGGSGSIIGNGTILKGQWPAQ